MLVLLALRLRSRAPTAAVVETFDSLGGAGERGAELLAAAEALDQVRRRGEEMRWSLTPAGSAELAAHLAAETDRAGRADLITAYEAFLPQNRAFLAAVSSGSSLAEVRGLVDELVPVLRALTARLARFGGYEYRFSVALARAADDDEWIARPSVDSVHTIWFELHEHLLATLGRDRTQERVRLEED
ncbi:MAG: hypothetical protein RIB98_05435 [Acidimicrobiales bacterium]